MVGLLLFLPGLVLLSEDASRVIDWVQGRGDSQTGIFLLLSDLGSRLLPAELLAQFITEFPKTEVLLRLPAGPSLTLVGLLTLGLPLVGRRRMRDRKGAVSAADRVHS